MNFWPCYNFKVFFLTRFIFGFKCDPIRDFEMGTHAIAVLTIYNPEWPAWPRVGVGWHRTGECFFDQTRGKVHVFGGRGSDLTSRRAKNKAEVE